MVRINSELILTYMSEHNLSKTAFIKQCGISMNSLKKLLSNDRDFQIKLLFKLANTMNIKVNALYIEEPD